jgi:hypothetical protein
MTEYLGKKNYSHRDIQVSLALIGYWYKTFHPTFFFQNEQDCWKHMIESLGIMISSAGKYSLKSFDEKGNCIG